MSTLDRATDWGRLATPLRTEVPPGSPQWKDNAYLGFWDADADVWGLFHWSASPNPEDETAIYGQLTVSVDGRTYETIEPLAPGAADYSSETIRFELGDTVSGTAQAVGHHGPPEVRLDLTMAPRYAPADYSQSAIVPSLEEGQGLNHLHATAFVRGTVTVDGETRQIDGLGWRDRTWGFRDESAHLTEYLALLVAFETFDVSVFKFRQPDGTIRTHGFILREHEHDVITDAAITRDASGMCAAMTVTTEDGRELVLRRDGHHAHHYCPMGPTQTAGPAFSVVEEFFDMHVEGGESGRGLVEHGILRALH
jgi:hypothetical protein